MLPAVYRRTYCRTFLTLFNQKSRYKIKCMVSLSKSLVLRIGCVLGQKCISISNKFNFWNVHGIMNTSVSCKVKVKLTYFARDPTYSWFHEHSENWIHFLNGCHVLVENGLTNSKILAWATTWDVPKSLNIRVCKFKVCNKYQILISEVRQKSKLTWPI